MNGTSCGGWGKGKSGPPKLTYGDTLTRFASCRGDWDLVLGTRGLGGRGKVRLKLSRSADSLCSPCPVGGKNTDALI